MPGLQQFGHWVFCYMTCYWAIFPLRKIMKLFKLIQNFTDHYHQVSSDVDQGIDHLSFLCSQKPRISFSGCLQSGLKIDPPLNKFYHTPGPGACQTYYKFTHYLHLQKLLKAIQSHPHLLAHLVPPLLFLH